MLTKLLSISTLLFTASNAVIDCTGANTFDLTTDSLTAAFANPTGFSASSAFSFTPECANIYVTMDAQLYLDIKAILGPGPLRILTETEVDSTTIDITQDILKTPNNVPYQLRLTLVDSRRRLATAVTAPASLTTTLTSTGVAGDEYTLNIDASGATPSNLEYDSTKSPPSTDELIDIANTAALDLYITAIGISFPITTPGIEFQPGKVYALDTMVDATLARALSLEHVEVVTLNQTGTTTVLCHSVILDIIDGVIRRDFTLTITDCECGFAGYNGCCNGEDFETDYYGLGSGQLQACVACYGTANTYYALSCFAAECEALNKDIVGCCLVEGFETPTMPYAYTIDNTAKDCCLQGGTMTSTTKTCDEACRSDTTLCADRTSVVEGCCFDPYGYISKTTQCDCNCAVTTSSGTDALPEFVLDQAYSVNNEQCVASCAGVDVSSAVCCTDLFDNIVTTTPYQCCVLNEGDATDKYTYGACPASCSFSPDPEGCCVYDDRTNIIQETLSQGACCEKGTTAAPAFDVHRTCDDACYTLSNDLTFDITSNVCCTDSYGSYDTTLSGCCGSGGSSVDINGNDCASACKAALSCPMPPLVAPQGCCIVDSVISAATECDCICDNPHAYSIEFVAEGSTNLDGYACSDVDCIGVDDILPGCCASTSPETSGTEYDCCVANGGPGYVFTEAECTNPCYFTEERTGCCSIAGTETDQTEQYCCENDGEFNAKYLCDDVCRVPSETNKICCEISDEQMGTSRSSDQTEAYCCNAGGILSTQTCENDCRADATQCKDPLLSGCCTDVDGATTLKTECDCNCKGLGVGGAFENSNAFTAVGDNNARGYCCNSDGTIDAAACPDDTPTTTAAQEEPTTTKQEDAPTTTATKDVPTTTATKEDAPTTTAEDVPTTTATQEDVPTTTTTAEDAPTTTVTQDDKPTTTVTQEDVPTTTTQEDEPTTTSTEDAPTTTPEEDEPTTTPGCDTTQDKVRTDYCCTDTEGDETDVIGTEYDLCTSCSGSYAVGTCCNNDNSISSVLTCIDLECAEEPYLAMVLEFDVCSDGGMGNSRNELFGIIQDCVGVTLDGNDGGVSVNGLHLTVIEFLFKGKQSSDENALCTTADNERGYTYRFGLSLCGFICDDLLDVYEYVLDITEAIALNQIDKCVLAATNDKLNDIGGSFTVAITGDNCERVDVNNSGSGIEMVYPSLMVFVLGLVATLYM